LESEIFSFGDTVEVEALISVPWPVDLVQYSGSDSRLRFLSAILKDTYPITRVSMVNGTAS
jgi:hypothetical protein